MIHKFDYSWTLEKANFTKAKGKVFSCFACGGGSSMGYKLAGFDVIGCNEIDPRMMSIYDINHHPRFKFLCDIRELVNTPNLPNELYQLDVLDGSPPCSTFSIAGDREKSWGKEKVFKEGQKKQVLDTLFFDFIALAQRLKPKVVIAENVKGLLLGSAIQYVRRIYEAFDEAGYYCQHFLLNGADMGLPQQRERVFFLCLRKDIATPFLEQKNLFERKPKIDVAFSEDRIPFRECYDGKGREIPKGIRRLWDNRQVGDATLCEASERVDGKVSFFGQTLCHLDRVCLTLTSKEDCQILYDEPRYLSVAEWCKLSSFPLDYNFMKQSPFYVMGMSVPPVMMAQVASRVYDFWLSNSEVGTSSNFPNRTEKPPEQK